MGRVLLIRLQPGNGSYQDGRQGSKHATNGHEIVEFAS